MIVLTRKRRQHRDGGSCEWECFRYEEDVVLVLLESALDFQWVQEALRYFGWGASRLIVRVG